MKRTGLIFAITLLFIISLSAISCSSGGSDDSGSVTPTPTPVKYTFTCSDSIQSVTKDSGTVTFHVSTTYTSWDAVDTSSWTKTTVSGNIITVKYAENKTTEERTSYVSITSGGTAICKLVLKQAKRNFPSYNTNPLAADETGMTSTATQLAKQIYAGWNLGNSLESSGSETAWGNPATTKAMIDMVKANGFNAIRIPCGWSQNYLSNASKATILSGWLQRVKQVVDYCIEDGLYVIINIHWDGGWIEERGFTDTSESNVSYLADKQTALWEQIATYFRNYDEHLIFAGMNEPGQSLNTDFTTAQNTALLRYEQAFVNAVRSTGGKNYYRNLIVQGPRTNIDNTYKAYNTLPTDVVSNRMMVEVHYYDPYQFTGLKADETWGKMFYYWGDYHYSSSTHNASWGEKSYVDTEFGYMKSKYVTKGIPVILGEYGASYRDLSGISGESQDYHNKSIQQFYEYVTQQAKNNGIVPFVWDNGNQLSSTNKMTMALFNRSSLTVSDNYALTGIKNGAAAGSYPY